MSNYREKYEFWKSDSFFDEETRAELAALTDEKEIEYPSSYYNNTEKEEITLAFVENVRQQFQMIFPKRAELFLTPFNECGIRVSIS